MKTYTTMREAGIGGLTEALPLARRDKWEYGGYIVRVLDRFSATTPVTSKSSEFVTLNAAWEAFTGETFPHSMGMLDFQALNRRYGIVSSYHIHGCDWELKDGGVMVASGKERNVIPEGFSPADLVNGILHGFDEEYIAVACTGKAYVSPPWESEKEKRIYFVWGNLGFDTGRKGIYLKTIEV